jgi:hypothetical protein
MHGHGEQRLTCAVRFDRLAGVPQIDAVALAGDGQPPAVQEL